MYQKETLATFGDNMVVLVVEEGKGIKNFRIFSKTDNAVDVGFSLEKVRTPVIKEYTKKTRTWHDLYRTYYVVDLNKDKLYRVEAVSAWSRFPARTRKKAIVLAEYTDAEYSLDERNGELRCQCMVNNSNYWNTKRWADEADMPGSIHVLDLEEKEVHKVTHMIFLN